MFHFFQLFFFKNKLYVKYKKTKKTFPSASVKFFLICCRIISFLAEDERKIFCLFRKEQTFVRQMKGIHQLVWSQKEFFKIPLITFENYRHRILIYKKKYSGFFFFNISNFTKLKFLKNEKIFNFSSTLTLKTFTHVFFPIF